MFVNPEQKQKDVEVCGLTRRGLAGHQVSESEHETPEPRRFPPLPSGERVGLRGRLARQAGQPLFASLSLSSGAEPM